MNSKSESGVGIPTTLFVVFLVLKLTGNLAWSWWWVFAPLWIPFVLVLGIGLIAVPTALIFGRNR